MHTKFVIFVIIGSLLVATMHSSSTLFVFAELLTSCENLNETKAHCTITYGESYQLGSDCTKNPDGTYSCTQDQDQDHKTNLKVTDEDAIQLGSDCTKNPDGTYSCTQDQDQDHKTNLKVTDEDAIQLGSDCTKNPDGTYSCTQDQDQDHDNNDTSAKTPSAPDPIPIPYPNTNNTTKAQIATD
jgi:hypothetical protein